MGYGQHLNADVPQTEPLRGQVANSAGGYSFPVSDWTRLERFLILGSEGGSYYASERQLTVENVACVERCLAEDGPRVVRTIVEISHAGRAPKNDAALVALAVAMKKGDDATRVLAGKALPQVARIGTHLFHFAEYVKRLGGWGRVTTTAFANWYESMPAEQLALQAMKYQSRDGWSHADLLRKAHPEIANTESEPQRGAIFQWMVDGWPSVGNDPHPDAVLAKIWAFEKAKTARGSELIKLIEQYGLPNECVPNETKNDPRVWAAMLPSMGTTALVRNLGKMTAVELLKPFSAEEHFVVDQLSDVDKIKKGRLHPLNLLVALRTYVQGHGEKGSLSWSPNQKIVDALDGAFYAAFQAVTPTGKRHLLGIDVSGSMGAKLANMPITCREGAAAMALVTANVEDDSHFFAFHNGFMPLNISARQRLDDVTKSISDLNYGGTDCALPMVYALQNKIPVDVFCVYTDSETYAGIVHPSIALQQYRQKMGIPAKLVVLGMASNGFTIADPNDGGMIDVVGFDTSTPGVIADFAR